MNMHMITHLVEAKWCAFEKQIYQWLLPSPESIFPSFFLLDYICILCKTYRMLTFHLWSNEKNISHTYWGLAQWIGGYIFVPWQTLYLYGNYFCSSGACCTTVAQFLWLLSYLNVIYSKSPELWPNYGNSISVLWCAILFVHLFVPYS